MWAAPNVDADLERIALEQRVHASRDVSRVPIFLIRRSNVGGPAPTLSHGDGGLGIGMLSFYEPNLLAWIEQGGGHRQYPRRRRVRQGRHEAGRLDNEQTRYDDFIAAAAYLHAERIVTRDGLAVHGESNGGLLVGVVVSQRPDLFAAALPGVGVMDMLWFNRFTGGSMWLGEFGDAADEARFGRLLAYSPCHNVAAARLIRPSR